MTVRQSYKVRMSNSGYCKHARDAKKHKRQRDTFAIRRTHQE